MRLFFLPWLSLISLRYVICYNRKVIDINENLFNLPVLLSWMHHLSVNHSEDSIIYGKEIKTLITNYLLKDYGGIEQDISKLIFRINDLRTLLVDNTEWQNAEYIVGKPVSALMLCLVSLKVTLGDLRNEIIKWENKDETGQSITIVKEKIPFKWFEEHGFTDITLKDAKIKDLKELVEGMYRDDLFSKKFLEFSGTILFLEPVKMLSCHLSFITTFVCSPKLVSMVEQHLKSVKEDLLPMASKLIESIRVLAAEGSPLRKAITSNRNEGLYTFAMEAYKHVVFSEKHIPKYLDALSWKSYLARLKISSFSVCFMYPMSYIDASIKKLGYYLKANSMNIPDLLSQLKILSDEDGPVERLAIALRNYNAAVTSSMFESHYTYTQNEETPKSNFNYSYSPEDQRTHYTQYAFGERGEHHHRSQRHQPTFDYEPPNRSPSHQSWRKSHPNMHRSRSHGKNNRGGRTLKLNGCVTSHVSLGIFSIAYVICIM